MKSDFVTRIKPWTIAVVDKEGKIIDTTTEIRFIMQTILEEHFKVVRDDKEGETYVFIPEDRAVYVVKSSAWVQTCLYTATNDYMQHMLEVETMIKTLKASS